MRIIPSLIICLILANLSGCRLFEKKATEQPVQTIPSPSPTPNYKPAVKKKKILKKAAQEGQTTPSKPVRKLASNPSHTTNANGAGLDVSKEKPEPNMATPTPLPTPLPTPENEDSVPRIPIMLEPA